MIEDTHKSFFYIIGISLLIIIGIAAFVLPSKVRAQSVAHVSRYDETQLYDLMSIYSFVLDEQDVTDITKLTTVTNPKTNSDVDIYIADIDSYKILVSVPTNYEVSHIYGNAMSLTYITPVSPYTFTIADNLAKQGISVHYVLGMNV